MTRYHKDKLRRENLEELINVHGWDISDALVLDQLEYGDSKSQINKCLVERLNTGTWEAIAEEMGISVFYVKKYYESAIRKLRKKKILIQYFSEGIDIETDTSKIGGLINSL